MQTILLYLLQAMLVHAAMAHPAIYFIRHGEKPKDGGDGLSAKGLERAQCLRQVFGAGSGYNIGLIMAQRPKPNGKRARPYQTVAPLGKDLGIAVDISCERNDYKCVKSLVENYEGDGNILKSWGGHGLEAPKYPDDRFDIIWTDPSPYSEITLEDSERCPGLDQPHRLLREV
ncbi:phosphoglycerate mutase family protein [Penicillium hetheringtonii]|uniref:Phosphoglycerate mutase family protein n=1 Tax=Penicillium hetheringtonii TaxID=911720 RepID=A0AAD6E501_9EURO|nr:phosphoglycerate mutase family protein [Penicillium hetheringtonii]